MQVKRLEDAVISGLLLAWAKPYWVKSSWRLGYNKEWVYS